MRNILLGLALAVGFAGSAQAATDVNIVFSSATSSGILVSTGVTVRVDNWINGLSTAPVQATRISVTILNLDSADDIYCAFQSVVSTSTVTNFNLIGRRIGAGIVVTYGASRTVEIYCQCEDAGGAGSCAIYQEQIHKP